MEDFFEDLKNQPRPNIFKRIWLWWEHDGKYYHKYFIQGVKNIIYWFPIIWKDRNWDGHYIYEIMKHKLKAQANYIGRRDFHTRAQQDARRMRLCVKLIEACQEEPYSMEYMDYHETEMFYNKIEDKDLYELDIQTKSENFKEYFAKYPRQYKRVLNGDINMFQKDIREKDDKIIAMEIAHENQERCRKLLHKILEDNLEKWWD
jgi:hypothetical protein